MNDLHNRMNFLNSNLLNFRDKTLIKKIQNVKCLDNVIWKTSQSGHMVPFILGKDCTGISLHSLYNPVKEAQRLPQYKAAGFFIFYGIGAGHHIKAFLSKPELTGAIIIEPNIRFFRTILEKMDLSYFWKDPRIILMLGEHPVNIESYLLQDYIPAIDGGLSTVILHSLVNDNLNYYEKVTTSINSALKSVSIDYTTQTNFGFRWFSNILSNLPLLYDSFNDRNEWYSSYSGNIDYKLKQNTAIIVGAGPSLEELLPQLKKIPGTIFACDTSLPILLKNNINPEIIVSIDCQHASYLHFTTKPVRQLTVLDLASPPIIARKIFSPLFFSSNHPFSQYISKYWKNVPTLPTTAGNVAYTAIELARVLDAEHIILIGTDYSFPNGRRYAREAAIYPIMWSTQNRFTPTTTKDISPILKAKVLKTKIGTSIIYETLQTQQYRKELEKLAPTWNQNLLHFSGKAPRLKFQKKEYKNPINLNNKTTSLTSQSNKFLPWDKELELLLDQFIQLPPPSNPLRSYLNSLSTSDRDLVSIMLPTVAVIRKQEETNNSIYINPAQLLQKANVWIIKKLKLQLEMRKQ